MSAPSQWGEMAEELVAGREEQAATVVVEKGEAVMVAAAKAAAAAAGSRTDWGRACKCLRDSCTSGSCRRCQA